MLQLRVGIGGLPFSFPQSFSRIRPDVDDDVEGRSRPRRLLRRVGVREKFLLYLAHLLKRRERDRRGIMAADV